jgi:hypothetical protein
MRKIEGNKMYNYHKRKKPLYQEIEDKYNQEIKEPEEQRIKQDMMNRKMLYRPI